MNVPLIPAVLALALCAAFTPISANAADRAEPVDLSSWQVQSAPESEPRALVQALRKNRVLDLARLSGNEASLRADYAITQARYAAELKDPDHLDRNDPELAHLWAQLYSEAGRKELETQWSQLIQTELPKIRAQWPMFRAMASSSLEASGDLPADSQASVRELLLALDGYLLQTDFSDRAKLRATISDLGGLVESSGVAYFYDLRSLSFEQAIALAQRSMATGKRIFVRYGVDADAILDSYEVLSTSNTPERAQLRQTIKVLGVPVLWYQELAWNGQAWVEPESSPEEQAAGGAGAATVGPAAAESPELPEPPAPPEPPTPSGKCTVDSELATESGKAF